MTDPITLDLSELPAEAWRASGFPPPGGLAFDIGANIGQNLPVLTDLYDQVVALEPCEESFSRITAGDRVTLLMKAAAARTGTVVLSERSAPMWSGQLVAPGMTNHDWGPELGVREVPSVTVDDLAAEFGQPDFVKIDTEGGELDVLAGAADTITGGHAAWMVEYHSPLNRGGVLRVFADAGYDVVTVVRYGYQPGSREALNHGYMHITRKG